MPLMNVNFIESNPIPVKAAMALMGLLEPVYRLPMVAPQPENLDKIRSALQQPGPLRRPGCACCQLIRRYAPPSNRCSTISPKVTSEDEAAAPFIMEGVQDLTVLQDAACGSASYARVFHFREVPSGWLGDRRGPRRVLTRIVLWWSGFTMLTGAKRLCDVVSIRFCSRRRRGAFPNMA